MFAGKNVCTIKYLKQVQSYGMNSTALSIEVIVGSDTQVLLNKAYKTVLSDSILQN